MHHELVQSGRLPRLLLGLARENICNTQELLSAPSYGAIQNAPIRTLSESRDWRVTALFGFLAELYGVHNIATREKLSKLATSDCV
jgi:hypothetical protein